MPRRRSAPQPTDDVISLVPQAYRSRIRELRIVPVAELAPHPLNYRRHPPVQRKALSSILDQIGVVKPALAYVSARNGDKLTLIDGHLRSELIDPLPVLVLDVDDAEADTLLATLDPIAALARADAQALQQVLASLTLPVDDAVREVMTKYDDILAIDHPPVSAPIDELSTRDASAPPPLPSLDAIYTFPSTDQTCCVAYRSGLYVGIRSDDQAHRSLCANHPYLFVDNHYQRYDHEHHKRLVAKLRPKYATVVDIYTENQAKLAGIDPWIPFDEVMKYAEDLEQYAEKIIVIPKYDCIADIPERYIIGCPTVTTGSVAYITLPVDMYKHRTVHILGGSINQQYRKWWELTKAGARVVSCDTNYIHLQAKYGSVSGLLLCNELFGTAFAQDAMAVGDFTKLPFLPNPLMVSFAISAGIYAAIFSNRVRRSS